MKPTKQIVYLPNKSCTVKNDLIIFPNGTRVTGTIGYFFTPEQLNEYTANVIRQALDTAAKKEELKQELVKLILKDK